MISVAEDIRNVKITNEMMTLTVHNVKFCLYNRCVYAGSALLKQLLTNRVNQIAVELFVCPLVWFEANASGGSIGMVVSAE